MKKLMMLAAVTALLNAAVAAAGEYYQAGSATVAAGVSNATGEVRLDTRMGVPYAEVERITVKNGSATNAIITFYAVEAGVETQIAQSGTIAAGGSEVLWPEKALTRTVVDKIVTNGVVTASTVTNTVTEYRLWPACRVKMAVQQETSTAASATYTWGVFAK